MALRSMLPDVVLDDVLPLLPTAALRRAERASKTMQRCARELPQQLSGELVWLIGGNDGRRWGALRSRAVRVFDPCAGAGGGWAYGPELSQPRAQHAAAAVGRTLLVIRGSGDGEGQRAALLTTEALDLTNPSAGWRAGPALRVPRREPLAAVVGATVYLIGGGCFCCDPGRPLSSVDVLDTAAGPGAAWATGPPLRAGRRHAAVAVTGCKIWVMGGWSSQQGDFVVLRTVELLDTTAGPDAEWVPGPELPTGRESATAAVVGSTIFLIGGHEQCGGRGPGPPLCVLTLDTTVAGSAWSAGPELAGPRRDASAAVAGGAIYLIGGERGISTLDSMEVLTPDGASTAGGPDAALDGSSDAACGGGVAAAWSHGPALRFPLHATAAVAASVG